MIWKNTGVVQLATFLNPGMEEEENLVEEVVIGGSVIIIFFCYVQQ